VRVCESACASGSEREGREVGLGDPGVLGVEKEESERERAKRCSAECMCIEVCVTYVCTLFLS
jgi:hypothetical protein